MQVDQENINQNTRDDKVALISSPNTFSPFMASAFKVQGNSGFIYGIVYSPRHNMIIACPMEGKAMQFYDATTLLPLRETQRLDGSVVQMSFDPETDTYLMGCNDGSIYLYHASSNELKKLKKLEKSVHIVTFVNSRFYAFSFLASQKLFIGNIENEDVTSIDLPLNEVYSQKHLNEQNLLITGLETGSVMVSRTDKLPHLQVLCSTQAHQAHDGVIDIEKVKMNGKEYIITASTDRSVRIWHLTKGKMRLLKVIQTGYPFSVVYLENYKMIAIVEEKEIKFLSFPFGKLESAIPLGYWHADYLFLMKEKSMIGASSQGHSVVRFIQLEGAQKGGV